MVVRGSPRRSPRPRRCDTSLAKLFPEDFALPKHCDDGGSQMRKLFVALLLLSGAVMCANPILAAVDDPAGSSEGLKMMNAQMNQELMSRAARLRTSVV